MFATERRHEGGGDGSDGSDVVIVMAMMMTGGQGERDGLSYVLHYTVVIDANSVTTFRNTFKTLNEGFIISGIVSKRTQQAYPLHTYTV